MRGILISLLVQGGSGCLQLKSRFVYVHVILLLGVRPFVHVFEIFFLYLNKLNFANFVKLRQ
jgi:hypothetical protein